MTAVCIRNLTYSAFENYIKVIKIYGCEKDDGITLTQAFITLFIIFPHPSFFCAKNKLDWTIRDWTHFFQQKNYMCSNMHKCKKMVFTFDKKILIIQQFMWVESAFDIAKKYHLYHWAPLNVIYSKKFLEKKYHLIKKKYVLNWELVNKTTFLFTQNFNWLQFL